MWARAPSVTVPRHSVTRHVDASIPTHGYRKEALSAQRLQRPSRDVESPRFDLGQNRCDAIAARKAAGD